MSWQSLVFGGLLPIVAFTVLEENYGPLYGLIGAMIFGVGEIVFEKIKQGKVSGITWGANGLIFALGLLSIFTQEGLWFKLQPAIMEVAMTAMLWGTQLMGKPMLVELSRKQNPDLPETMFAFLREVNFRTGIFFLVQAGLAVYAALYWSTQAWAWLKGLGVTVSFVVYLFVEVFVFRWRLNKRQKNNDSQANIKNEN